MLITAVESQELILTLVAVEKCVQNHQIPIGRALMRPPKFSNTIGLGARSVSQNCVAAEPQWHMKPLHLAHPRDYEELYIISKIEVYEAESCKRW